MKLHNIVNLVVLSTALFSSYLYIDSRYALADELKTVIKTRLDYKIISDQLLAVQKQLWAVEDQLYVIEIIQGDKLDIKALVKLRERIKDLSAQEYKLKKRHDFLIQQTVNK